MLRLLGDLIYVQKRKETLLQFLRVLARLKKTIIFSKKIIVDVGFRSFKVLLEDDGIPTLRSKVVQAPATTDRPSTANLSQRILMKKDVSRNNDPLPKQSTHQVHHDLKGNVPEK